MVGEAICCTNPGGVVIGVSNSIRAPGKHLKSLSGIGIIVLLEGATARTFLERYGYRFTWLIAAHAGDGEKAIAEAILDDRKLHPP
jgi:hypothetical protein